MFFLGVVGVLFGGKCREIAVFFNGIFLVFEGGERMDGLGRYGMKTEDKHEIYEPIEHRPISI